MFNSDFKKEEIAKLESAHEKYEARAEKVAKQSVELMQLRHDSSKTLITEVEQYINSLANSPKMLDKSFAEYKADFSSFSQIIDDLREESVDSSIKSGISAGAGVAAGVGVAAFAPTAAMGGGDYLWRGLNRYGNFSTIRRCSDQCCACLAWRWRTGSRWCRYGRRSDTACISRASGLGNWWYFLTGYWCVLRPKKQANWRRGHGEAQRDYDIR